MGYDLKRSHFSIVLEKGVLAGETIKEEGVLLVSVLDAATGVEVVRESEGAATDVIAGFAIRDNADHATTSVVETFDIPASLTVPLLNNQLALAAGTIAGNGAGTNIRVVADGTPLIVIDGNPVGAAIIPPAAGEVGVDDASGTLTFNVAENAQSVVATYTYNLTVAESRQKFFQRNINNEASALFGQVGVGHGHGEVFTDAFDATVDWSVAGQAVVSGVAGQLTGSGTGVTLDARVISVPNVNNPLLGIAFNIGGSVA